jgi:cyclopropane fatty-acyl-phospholipid synthase-like methyltransferase
MRNLERRETVSSIVRRFRGQPWSTRLYLGLRRVVLPLDAVERHVPRSGVILDAGCGYGLLSILMATRSAERDVIGVDLDAHRISVARAASRGISRVRFEVGDLAESEVPGVTAIVLIDALQYFDAAMQRDILIRMRRMLNSDGVLVCRTPVRESGPRFWWSWLHERVTVGLSFTATRDRSVHVLTLSQFISQMQSAGFEIERIERPRKWLPYTDRLIVARKAVIPRSAAPNL